MVIGVLEIEFRFHDVHSLKAKRGQVKKIVHRLRNQFNAAVAEVHSQDLWQRAGVGVAVVANNAALVDACMSNILNAADRISEAEIIDHHSEIINI